MTCTICETALNTNGSASVALCLKGRAIWLELEDYTAHPDSAFALRNRSPALREFRAHTGHAFTKVYVAEVPS